LATDSSAAWRRAEANFKKEQRAKDAENAMADYEAQAHVVREKTARLRALRLAKEATEQKAQPKPKLAKASGRR
jgi:hypothetical protein